MSFKIIDGDRQVPPPDIEPQTANCFVSLVHGTFAQGAKWIQDESLFATELRELGQGRLRTLPFEWSGKNTHEARVAAGRALANSLVDRAKQYPSSYQAIIAHSHGGNIALYAARAAGIPNLKIVTLGTPFVHAFPRRFEANLVTLLYGSLLISLVAVIFLGAILLGFSIYIYSGTWPDAVWAGATILCFLTVFPFLDRYGERWRNKLLPLMIDRQNWLADELPAACTTQSRLLIASVRGDEAMRALSALDVVANIPYQLVSLLSVIILLTAKLGEKVMPRPGRVLVIVMVALAFVPGAGELFTFLFLVVPFWCLILSIPVFLLGFVRRAGHWDDGLLDYAVGDISVNMRPMPLWTPADVEATRVNPASSPVGAVLYPSRSVWHALIFQRLLQHSTLYQRKDIATEIGDWLLYDRWPSGASPLWPVDDEDGCQTLVKKWPWHF
jgi:hypothetical protein